MKTMSKWIVVAITAMAALAFLAAVACGQKSDGDKSGGIQGVVTGPAGTPASEMRVGTVSETASVPVKSGETATRLSVLGAAGAEQIRWAAADSNGT